MIWLNHKQISLIQDVLWVCLLPFSWVWAFLASLRWKKSLKSPDEPTEVYSICLGSIAAGGSGKTPLVAALASSIGQGRVGIVVRGYCGKIGRRSEELFRDREGGPIFYGDEAWVLSRELKARVFVGSNRMDSLKAIADAKIRIAIIDDGVQSPRLKKDFKIAVLSSSHLPTNAFTIPLGTFRSSPITLKDFDAIVVTRPKSQSNQWEAFLEEYFKHVPRFEAIWSFWGLWNKIERIDDRIKGLAFCGIGSPENFEGLVQEHLPNVRMIREFPNHHRYGQRDAHWLIAQAERLQVDHLVTTEKDWVKMESLLRGYPIKLVYCRIKYELPNRLEAMVNEAVTRCGY